MHRPFTEKERLGGGIVGQREEKGGRTKSGGGGGGGGGRWRGGRPVPAAIVFVIIKNAIRNCKLENGRERACRPVVVYGLFIDFYAPKLMTDPRFRGVAV